MLSHTAPHAWLKERGVFVHHVALKPMKHRRKAQETQCDTCGQHVTGEAQGWEKPRKRSVQTGLCARSPALEAPHPPTQPADLQPQVQPDTSPSKEGGAVGATHAQPSTGTCCAQACALDPTAGVVNKDVGMQDKAGCSGGAKVDGAEQPSHLPCARLPLPLSLPGDAVAQWLVLALCC